MEGIFESKLIMGFIIVVVAMSYINGQQVSNQKTRIAENTKIKVMTTINE